MVFPFRYDGWHTCCKTGCTLKALDEIAGESTRSCDRVVNFYDPPDNTAGEEETKWVDPQTYFDELADVLR